MLGRDASRNPVSLERDPPVDWDVETGRNIRWKARVGSIAFADPVVADGMVWIGSNNWRPWHTSTTNEAATLLGFRERDGFPLCEHVMPPLQGPMHRLLALGLNCSPLVEGESLWFVSVRGEVVAWDLGPLHRGQGPPEERWKRDLIEEFDVYPRMALMADGKLCSIGASYRDRIFVVTANGAGPEWPPGSPMPAPEAPSLICFHKDTGEVLWTDRSPGTNVIAGQWGSPLVAEIKGRGQVITPQGDGWVRSFDAETGMLLWKFDINSKSLERPDHRNHFLNTPVLYENRIYIGGGRDLEQGDGPGRLWCIDPTKEGDVSLDLETAPGQGSPNPNSGAVWHYDGLGRTRSNVAIRNGLVIAAGYDGTVHCLDAATGRLWWKLDTRGRLFASPLIVDDTVYVANEDSVVHVLALERELRVLARHEMNQALYASPVFANGTLYLATQEFLYAISAGPAATAHDWPQWRGPDRSNVSRETGLLRDWPANGPPLLWTVTGLGEGITAMAIADGTAYTLGYRDDTEFLFALDAASGEHRWLMPVGTVGARRGGAYQALMRWLSPRVPTVDDDRIYTITAEGELTCLRTDSGQVLWRKRYPYDFLSPPRMWGFCDYPLVDGENLICVPGGAGATVVALNKWTGAVVWKTGVSGGEQGTHGATVLSAAGGVRHYVTFLLSGPIGIAADDGRILWHYERSLRRYGGSYTPIVREPFVLAANGYGWGLALLKVAPQIEGLSAVEQYYQAFNFNPFQDNTVVVRDYVYAVQGPGQLVCLEWLTGKRVWEQPVPNPQVQPPRRVALTYADKFLYVRRSDGSITRVEAAPGGYVEKGSFQIPEPEEVSGVTAPVIAHGRLYLRDNRRLLCYDLRSDALAMPSVSPQIRQVPWSASPGTRIAKSSGPLPTGINRAPDAIYVPTPDDIIGKMLELADLNADRVLYDLGSGDGRIIIAAAREYGCRAVGFEIDRRLVEQSREAIRTRDLEHLASIEHADIFTVDLSNADVVAVYLPSNLLERLRPQFDKLKPGAQIVSHQFPIPGVRVEPPIDVVSTEDGDRHRVYHYVLPLTTNLFRGPSR
jgi:outer membrane protein assembly factor BamB